MISSIDYYAVPKRPSFIIDLEMKLANMQNAPSKLKSFKQNLVWMYEKTQGVIDQLEAEQPTIIRDYSTIKKEIAKEKALAKELKRLIERVKFLIQKRGWYN